MNQTITPPKRPQHRQGDAACCTETDCGPGMRNRYFPGKRLTPDSFTVEQEYLVERRRLLNRALHGWGVVYGYPVAMAGHGGGTGRISIGAGLALDRVGRELVQVEATRLDLSGLMLIDENGALQAADATRGNLQPFDPKDPRKTRDACWLLQAHYAERLLEPLTFSDPCSCERREWNHVCETVRYSLRRVDCAECCADFACELDCECATGPCCEDALAPAGQPRCEEEHRPQREPRTPGRGGCRCLCDHLTGLEIGAECTALCVVDDPCGPLRVDLHNPVPLACLKLRRGECGWELDAVFDDCGPRRLVKRNDLLFDLIRGCDLTRIVGISWGAWHRRADAVAFSDFDDYFGQPYKEGSNLTKFSVRFSRPVLARTVTAECFVMTAFFREKEGGWRDPLRVPIVGVLVRGGGDLAEEATLLVRTRWVSDAIRGGETRFDGYGARVEIEIRGDFILDCNGQAVDADAVGLRDVPSGNGTPGGTYLSTFRVGKRTVPADESTC